ncbi:hypothetical protein [Streptomyces sp. NRRL S-237]|nr:hypothetical protein [Streptomyces sp. NRRL S-237]
MPTEPVEWVAGGRDAVLDRGPLPRRAENALAHLRPYPWWTLASGEDRR